ncbi:RES family NAD+ phosphorylase [Luteolibacter ambystomatis]|uniref:RES family NAD+ phosphorylase n=1 Tax=Luteolibacter ambystomatis TaxID=2824561 RepID=A0A975G5W1_9BACT|nr:RES family NAD+ phosphorylase [Luteolibacter ambystomatis]QUE49533.1 RES family NAD+ phosphorylase [Luteolibacter ambystomatis]
MSVTAYRITKTKHLASAFDGEGARLYGGRWNSQGTRMVYAASSISLATLEILVHTDDVSMIMGQYSTIPIGIPEALILRVLSKDLPAGWFSPEPPSATQIFGDEWIRSGRSAVMAVPSAVTNEESNYLLNPAHPDFAALSIGQAGLLRLDTRLR